MHITVLTLLVVLVNVHVTAALNLNLTGQQIAQDFRSLLSPGSGIYLPTDANWANEMTQRWNAWSAPTYVVSVKPALKEDVQKVVQYASKNNVSFLATGAGHGYSGSLASLRNGIELDLGNFNSISVDAAKNLMTIGGSVRFRDLVEPCYAAGKAITVGNCPCVGMAGATLGGGIGFYSGVYGAIADSLVSVEMVTGNGDLITVSDSQNADLFWGVKGAGFNFGVVTSLTYQVYDDANAGQVMTADMTFTGSQNGSLWNIAQSFFGNQPKELSLVFSLQYNSTLGEIVIIVTAMYTGPLEQGKQLLEPFLALNPTNLNISYVPWKDATDVASYGAAALTCHPGTTNVPYSVNLYKIDVEGLSRMVDFVNTTVSDAPELQTFVMLFTQYAAQGLKAHADNSSAFPYRDSILYAQIDGVAMNPQDVSAVGSFVRSVRDELQKSSGRDTVEVYTHFAHGNEGNAAMYTERKLPRLRELKKRYDPQLLFSNYNPIEVG